MIPRILHNIWLGPRDVPDQWAHAWRDMNPGWEYRLWREEDIRRLPLRLRRQYNGLLQRECWHGAADIARLEVLRNEGGVYVDIDSKPLRPLEDAPFLDASVFAAYEPVPSLPGRVANGTIGAVPHAPAIETNLDLIQRMSVLEPPYDTTGGTSLTAALLVHHRCCDIRVLPPRTFYPKAANGRPVPGSEQPYCEHFWSTTNHTYPPRAVVLVPRRGDGAERDRAWAFVEKWWRSHGFDVYVGEDEGPARFNAARARNTAAAAAGTWDVGIFADADTIPGDITVIRAAVERAHTREQFVRPFRHYWQMSEQGSARWVETGERDDSGRRLLQEQAHGGVAIVPRTLYEAVGGYDERFVGWGWEDTAFESACRVLGGFGQEAGEVFHLWHRISGDRNTSDPQFIANRALGQAYVGARNRRKMLAVISERGQAAPPSLTYGMVVTANGRLDLLEQTMEAVAHFVHPKPDRVLICDDSGIASNVEELRRRYPEATIDGHRHLGHGPAIARAWKRAAELPVDYILWMEEDMVWRESIDIRAVASVVSAAALAQMAFLRNSHFAAEVEAGPHQLSRFPDDAFVQESTEGHPWLRHSLFYTLNPHVVPRSLLRRWRWPPVPNSEHRFSRRLFRRPGVSVGMWGHLDDDPVILHAGTERTGTGY